MIRKIEVSILTFITIFFTFLPYANSNEQPYISILGYEDLGTTGTVYPFLQNLGKNKHEIISIENVSGLFKTKDVDGYHFFYLYDQGEGIYILKDNVNIGYYFITNNASFWSGNEEHNLELKKILELSKDENYLQGKIKIRDYLDITFYKRETESGEFIERFAILTESYNPYYHYLILNSFYPKSLEPELEKELIDQLNYFLERYF